MAGSATAATIGTDRSSIDPTQGQGATVTASTSVNLALTYRRLVIYDVTNPSNSFSVMSCTSQAVPCSVIDRMSWGENSSPRSRQYEARVMPIDTSVVEERSTTVTVEHQRYHFAVSMTASAASIDPTQTATLTGVADLVPNGYSIVLYDVTNPANPLSMQRCFTAQPCQSLHRMSWSENDAPVTRRFEARFGPTEGAVEDTSSVLTVEHRRHDFDLSLTADRTTIDPTSSANLVATTDVLPAGYWLVIYDITTSNSPSRRVICQSTSTPCTFTDTAPWSEDKRPVDRRYESQLIVAGEYNSVKGRSASLTVVHRRWFDPVALAVEQTGNDSFTLTATATKSISGTPYSIRILQDEQTPVASCSTGSVCSVSGARGHTYRAILEDATGWATSTSGSWTIPLTGAAQDQSVGPVDLVAAAALFPSPEALCEETLVRPGSHVAGSSLSDQTLACQAAASAGKSITAILGAIAATAGGAAYITSLVTTVTPPAYTPPPPGTVDPPAPGQPPAPDPGGPGGGRGPSGGTAKPPAPAISMTVKLSDDLAGRDITPKGTSLSQQQADVIAARCLRTAGQESNDGLTRCLTGRLFVTGNDVQPATDLDFDSIFGAPARNSDPAIAAHPQWSQLTHDGIDKPRRWTDYDSRCGLPRPSGEQCHEFPYNKTVEGGQENSPSLRLIDGIANVKQGGLFGAFVTYCGLATRSDGSFLVVPIPASTTGLPTVPTVGLCAPGDR